MNIPRARLALLLAFFFATALLAVPTLGQTAASGHGTLLVTNPDGHGSTRRQFSFSARMDASGAVKGNAVLVNPEFNGDKGQYYLLQIDISCMNVVGNTVYFGGTTRRTNDPNLVDAVYFGVQDNGEPGRNLDMITPAVFWDNDPSTTGDPGACVNIQPGDPNFPMSLIEAGNITVR